ncbi:MAG: hypothetical protein ACI4MM_06880 [Candidatus Ventricola sp.]
MKEMWETPRIAVEEFAANEYVAACWDVACTTGSEGGNAGKHDEHASVDDGRGNNNNHGKLDAGTGCGWASNQYIYDAFTDDNGVIWYGMNEVNVAGQDDLACTIYNDSNYSGTGSQFVSGLTNGQTIYWTTSNSRYTWFHYGIVNFFNSLHPNRS